MRDLEDERCKLRKELRYRAKWHGEAAAKMGLTSEQVILLEEYRDELRYGGAYRCCWRFILRRGILAESVSIPS